MTRFKKSIVLTLIVVMIFGQTVNSYGFTEEAVDEPSSWAVWDVDMAQVYGLGDDSTYVNYQGEAVGSQLLSIQAGFEEDFNVYDIDKIMSEDIVTREIAVKELYDVMIAAMIDTVIDGDLEVSQEVKASSALNNSEAAVKFFVEAGLLKGKSDGSLALEDICTSQELIVLSKRAYDYTVYNRGEEAIGCYWKVSDEDNTVFLLGSIHITDGTVYPLSKTMLEDFESAQYLAVEADIRTISNEDLVYIQSKMMLLDGTSIKEFLSEDTYEDYKELMEGYGLPPQVYQFLKPWYAAMLIQNMELMESDLEASLGIDMYFLNAAGDDKPIIELESIRFQIDMFDSFSSELQEGFLLGAIEGALDADDEKDDSTLTEEDTESDIDSESLDDVETLELMLTYWKEGNTKALGDMVLLEDEEDPIMQEFNEKLFTLRNKDMLDKVANMLIEDNESDYFVVVGAGHMLNDTGIVQGLMDMGYEVELVSK